MTVDDLIYKIGVLTIENDALRSDLQKVTRDRDELQAVVSASESDVEKSDDKERP